MKSSNQNQSNQTLLMLELLRSSLLKKKPTFTSTTIDWDSLMDQSGEEGILAWVWDGICQLPKELQPPRLQRINWDLSSGEITGIYEKQKHILSQILETCGRHEIRLLLLKGISLSHLYDKPQCRPCGDIDIFVFDDYNRFNHLYSEYYDYNYCHHDVFFLDGVRIENHREFIDTDTRQRKDINIYLRSCLKDVRLTPFGYYELPPMAYLIFLSVHSMHHIYCDSTITMRSLADFAMYLRTHSKELRPEDCFLLLKQFKIDKGFEVLLYMSEFVLGISFDEYHQRALPRNYVAFLKNWICSGYAKPSTKEEALKNGVWSYIVMLRDKMRIRRYMLRLYDLGRYYNLKSLKHRMHEFGYALIRKNGPNKMRSND